MSRFRFFSTFQEVLFLITHPWVVFRERLSEEKLEKDPFTQFSTWYKSARLSLTTEFPGAMCLSTVNSGGRPEARMVLLKGFDSSGFVFYTNLESGKGLSLRENPAVALTFYWGPAQRQIRIEGIVVPVDPDLADRYFAGRPRRSRIGAWASLQSRPLESRLVLEKRVEEFSSMYTGKPVPRPPYWSGFRVVPSRFEFWQLRLNRLHDRFVYEAQENGGWKIQRLYP